MLHQSSRGAMLTLLMFCSTTTLVSAQQLGPVQLFRAKKLSDELAQRGRPDSALTLLRQITSIDSADVLPWRQYAQLAAQQKLWLEAARAFEQVYALGGFNRGLTAFQVARMYDAAGRPSDALNWLERAFADRLSFPKRVTDDGLFTTMQDSARLDVLYPHTNTDALPRDERWRRDIDFFLREAQRMHVHAERPEYSAEFVRAIATLKARVPTSSDISLRLGLRRMVAMLRDGHSGIPLDSTMRMLPINLYSFSDGMFVVSGVGEANAYTGSQVVAIGKLSIETVSAAISAFLPHDNEMGLRALLPGALINTAFLTDVGASNADGSVDVTLIDRAGKRTVVRLTGGPLRSNAVLASGSGTSTPFYLERAVPFWTRDLPEARALYLNFNRVAETDSLKLSAFAQGLAVKLRNPAYRNVIIDVRLNRGGDTFLLPPLIQALASFTLTDSSRRIYVITSRHTFSAAQNFVGKVEWLLHPIFVGEPTGSAPNFTGEIAGTILPYSGIMITISNRIHMNSDWEDKRQWIAPQIPTSLSSTDFFQGRDPALDAIMAVARQAGP